LLSKEMMHHNPVERVTLIPDIPANNWK